VTPKAWIAVLIAAIVFGGGAFVGHKLTKPIVDCNHGPIMDSLAVAAIRAQQRAEISEGNAHRSRAKLDSLEAHKPTPSTTVKRARKKLDRAPLDTLFVRLATSPD